MEIKVEVQGLREVLAELASSGRATPQRIGQGLWEVGQNIMAASQELVPVDTGNLRASGHVELPRQVAGEVQVVLGYGGPAGSGNFGGTTNPEDAGYALRVHEDLQAHHVVGQAKFLEAAYIDYSPRVVPHLLSVLRGG